MKSFAWGRLALVFGLVLLSLYMEKALAQAPSWHLQLHGLSKHSDEKAVGKWNERNWGTGVRYQHNPTWGVQGGTFRNSYDRQSAYAIVDYTPLLGERVSIAARIIPKVRKEHTAVIALEAGWRFK